MSINNFFFKRIIFKEYKTKFSEKIGPELLSWYFLVSKKGGLLGHRQAWLKVSVIEKIDITFSNNLLTFTTIFFSQQLLILMS